MSTAGNLKFFILSSLTSSSFSSPSSSLSSSFSCYLPSFDRLPPLLSPHYHLKRRVCRRGLNLIPVSCLSKHKKQTFQTEAESTLPLSSLSGANGGNISEDDRDISAYRLCAAFGGIGFFETAYLTYLKLTDSEAFCAMGEGSCNTILNSDYSSVIGVPLPLLGMFAYGLVAFLGIQLGKKKRTLGPARADGEIILLGLTSSIAVASLYFLYVLTTEFDRETCFYCLSSAVLSFSLFFISLKTFGFKELQKLLGFKLTVASLVVIALTTSYSTVQSNSPSLAESELPYVETEIITESSAFAVALAKHLQLIGAKLYGAFWCSHCQHQKQIFGREASKYLDYVECYPDGVRKGTKMAQACMDIDLTGFPTWVINGKVLSGEKQLQELAMLSDMELQESGQPK